MEMMSGNRPNRSAYDPSFMSYSNIILISDYIQVRPNFGSYTYIVIIIFSK